jgi:DNA-binding transcriptional MocR family regulator
MIPLRMEVVIPLAKNGRPLFKQVYLGLRQGILSGTFPAGERLPSTRELADQLGVSRTVVLLAYDQLLAEGYAEGRPGSGTYVSGSLRLNSPRTLGSRPGFRFLASELPRQPPPASLSFRTGFRGGFVMTLPMAEATSRSSLSRLGAACCFVTR